MINVEIGHNLKSEEIPFDKNTTLREAFEAAGYKYAGTTITLDGAAISPGDLNKTFAELGYDGSEGHDEATLFAITKTDNAR